MFLSFLMPSDCFHAYNIILCYKHVKQKYKIIWEKILDPPKYIEENLAAVELLVPDNVIQDLDDLNMDVYGSRHNTYNLQFIDTEF